MWYVAGSRWGGKQGLGASPDFSRRLDAFQRLPERRGFSPAEIAAPALCWSRAPRSLRLVAAATAGHGTQE
jgi:hypothetical protein